MDVGRLLNSRNRCHESTSFALSWPRGVPGGTVTPDDLEQTEAIFIFGRNTSVSGPRMRQQSQAARQRDVLIVAFNPCANAPWSPGAPRLSTHSPRCAWAAMWRVGSHRGGPTVVRS